MPKVVSTIHDPIAALGAIVGLSRGFKSFLDPIVFFWLISTHCHDARKANMLTPNSQKQSAQSQGQSVNADIPQDATANVELM